MLVLVLESSTTSAKAMLYCSDRGVIRIETEAYPPHFNINGIQDAEGVFKRTVDLGRMVSEGKEIDMIALCGTWHNVMLCDRQMKPISPAYSWSYTGASQVAKDLRKDKSYTNAFYQKTGCMVHAIYPAFKLLYIRNQGFDIENCYICGQGSYNFFHLTGERLVSDSMASGSGLLNITSRQYDIDILKEIGIKEEQLGRLVSYKDIRPLSKKGAELLGLESGIPVIPANPDGGLNQVGAGALRDGIMTFSVGTSGAMRLSTSNPVLPEQPSIWCYLSPYSWMSGAATSGACNCIDWIKGKMFSSSTTYSEIESKKTNNNTYPVFLPFLYGERCPGWQDERKAGFFDVLPTHAPLDFYLGVMEGVLFNLYQCYEVLCNVNGKPKKIQLSGGILNSRIWTQMCCDIFQQEMECSTLEQTSMLGAAILSMEINGVVDNVKNHKVEKGTIICPDEKMKTVYNEKYQRYKYWYYKTKSEE